MEIPPVIRELSPLDLHTAHREGERYGYRGTIIEGVAGGWDVLAGDRPRDADYAEIGWGATMEDAMIVANEYVDGFERIKRAA